MDAKQRYKDREVYLKSHRDRANEELNSLDKIKASMIEEAINKAKLEVEKAFIILYGEKENMALYVLQSANKELVHMKCPVTHSNYNYDGQPFECDTCNFKS